MTMSIVQVGIVGCGEVTQLMHLPSLSQLQDKFHVTALCDISPNVVTKVADTWNVAKRFHDYQELVAQADVDAVLIANPNAYHAAVALDSIAAGKHVLIEKPMCITFREADAVMAAGESTSAGYGAGGLHAALRSGLHRSLPPGARGRGYSPGARPRHVLGSNSLFVKGTASSVAEMTCQPMCSCRGSTCRMILLRKPLEMRRRNCALPTRCCWA